MKVHQDHSKTYQELITGMLNSLLYAGGDAEGSDYKTSRNLDKQINIVTMLINNQLNEKRSFQLVSLTAN